MKIGETEFTALKKRVKVKLTDRAEKAGTDRPNERVSERTYVRNNVVDFVESQFTEDRKVDSFHACKGGAMSSRRAITTSISPWLLE